MKRKLLVTDTGGFQKLFEPTQIGGLKLRNRTYMPPMGTNMGTEDGHTTKALVDYYEERAKGGVGLIIVEMTIVDFPAGKTITRQLAIDHDKFVPGLTELAKAIKRHGAKAAIQLAHAGRTTFKAVTGLQPVAPSAIAARDLFRGELELPKELEVAEITRIISCFAKAAKRAKCAGFDGVEIHSSGAYLISQFLTPAWNKRQDGYGGCLSSRARFLLEIITAIRESVGPDFPLWCRLDIKQFGIDGGLSLEEGLDIVRMVEKAGVDAIHVSSYGLGFLRPPMAMRPGYWVPLAEAVKKVVTIPVMVDGKITHELGTRVLEEYKADLIGFGRSLIADPAVPNKVASGKLGDIRPCIYCDRCIESNLRGDRLLCAVNAAVGKEWQIEIIPAERVKRIFIIGGGPAGMEAARVASLRGHKVVIYEKENRLGGQLNLAAIPPYKNTIPNLISYLEMQIRKLRVRIELGQEVTAEFFNHMKSDAVIVATGVFPSVPEISGVDRSGVVFAADVLSGKAEVGNRVVVIGGELVACETAEFLASDGKHVTIMRRGERLAINMPTHIRDPLLKRLAERGVTFLTGVTYERITDIGLTIVKEGKRQTIQADTIVLAAGARPNNGLYQAISGKVSEIHLAGDCVRPRGIAEAIADGFRIGLTI